MQEIRKWKEEEPQAIASYIDEITARWEGDPCPVDRMMHETDLLRRGTCGECVICREGVLQVSILAKALTEGSGKSGDLDIIREVADNLVALSCCDYGRLAGRHIAGSLSAGMEVFEKHLRRKRCDSGTCEKLAAAQPAAPAGEGLMSGRRRRRSS